MKMRPKVSIDSIDRYYRYRSIDPLPIVPIYGPNLALFNHTTFGHILFGETVPLNTQGYVV
jgi:hypothetical protein